MDEFTIFLAVGLLFIVLVFALLGPWGPFSEITVINASGQATTTTTTLPTQVPTQESRILIGPQSVEVWRTIDLDKINVSYGSYEHTVGVESKRLYNGALFGSNKLEIHAPVDLNNFVGAYIEFTVEDTNKYAPLLVKINDLPINKTRFSLGTYKIVLDNKLIDENNTIEFIPLSSTWKIWAPTVYDLRDIKFVYLTHYSQPSTVKFTVYQSEYENLVNKDGRLILDLDEHKGKLNIELNGHLIFSNETRTYQIIQFDQSYLQPGENQIRFYSEENSNIQGNARMLIYYYTTKENKFEHVFSISEGDYASLDVKKGKISFNVTDIVNDGGMAVLIEDSSGVEHTLGYQAVNPGVYTFYFNSTYCTEGYNKVIIRSVDNAAFWISDFKVEI